MLAYSGWKMILLKASILKFLSPVFAWLLDGCVMSVLSEAGIQGIDVHI